MASFILNALVRAPDDCFYAPAAATSALPIAALAIEGGVRGLQCPERLDPVYGGYANGRGDIVLFAKGGAFHVNCRKQILKQRPPLNFGAQARYDATAPGEDFAYGNKTFRRLSHQQIADICAAGRFRIGSRF
jgi:hypothetical protein